MSEKRFEVVLNEFDEVEYIMDKKFCEDKDFAEFMNFVEELAKENEQLRKDVENLQEVVAELGATLLMNGFEIEINDENLSEMIDNG